MYPLCKYLVASANPNNLIIFVQKWFDITRSGWYGMFPAHRLIRRRGQGSTFAKLGAEARVEHTSVWVQKLWPLFRVCSLTQMTSGGTGVAVRMKGCGGKPGFLPSSAFHTPGILDGPTPRFLGKKKSGQWWDFPGCPVVRTPQSQSREPGFDPWSGT